MCKTQNASTTDNKPHGAEVFKNNAVRSLAAILDGVGVGVGIWIWIDVLHYTLRISRSHVRSQKCGFFFELIIIIDN